MSEEVAVLLDTSTTVQGSYNDMLKHAEEAMKWLTSVGVRVDATRAWRLLKSVDKLRCDLYAGKTQAPDLSQLWEIAELDDLIQIAMQFKSIDDQRFLQTLAKVTNGPHVLAEEKTTGGSIQGRNATFELFAAARFARAGLPVLFRSDADATIVTRIGDLALECKRVGVAERLEDNIREAALQIRRRMDSDGAKAGYVCISISRLVHQVAMENSTSLYADPAEFQLLARGMLTFFGQMIVERCCDLSPSVLAIGLHYKLPFLDKRTEAPTVMNRFVFYSLLNKGQPPEFQALEALVHETFQRQIDSLP